MTAIKRWGLILQLAGGGFFATVAIQSAADTNKPLWYVAFAGASAGFMIGAANSEIKRWSKRNAL